MKRRRCNSEEESADEEAGAGAPFRVSVCMEQWFSDERARAYVCVRRGGRVRGLLRRLRALFALPPRLALLCGAHLLPPAEPLAVLRPGDELRVIPSRIDFGSHWAEGDEIDEVDSACVTSVRELDPGRSSRSTAVQAVTNCTPSTDGAAHRGGAADARGETRSDDDGELAARKRRALLLLERCAAPAPPAPARPRRRRVRRRRRAVSPAAATSPAQSSPPLSPASTLLPAAATSPARWSRPLSAADGSVPAAPARGVAAAAMILRNGDQTPRAPRHIQPLADDTST